MSENIKKVLLIVGLLFMWVLLIWSNEEPPHIIIIDDHEYVEEVKWTHRDYQTIRNHSPECKICKNEDR